MRLESAYCGLHDGRGPRLGEPDLTPGRSLPGVVARRWSNAQADSHPIALSLSYWRGDPSTINVVVRGEALPGGPAEHLFDRLPDTNVWYRTYRFRDDARFMYMLSINDSLTPWEVEGPERQKRYAGVRTDPLNQRDACYVSLPRAPSERWIEERKSVAHGEIRRHRLPSLALSGEREIDAYATPDSRAVKVSHPS